MVIVREVCAHWACWVVVLASYPQPPHHLGCTGVLWVLTGTHPCGPPPKQNGGSYQSTSSCCGFVEWFVVVMNVSGIGKIGYESPTPFHGEWAAPASHRIRSPSPRVLPCSPLRSLRSRPPCLPLDCSRTLTVRTAAWDTLD